jgi:hypothetical protein
MNKHKKSCENLEKEHDQLVEFKNKKTLNVSKDVMIVELEPEKTQAITMYRTHN